MARRAASPRAARASALHIAVLVIVALWTLPTARPPGLARCATRTRSPPRAGGRRSRPPSRPSQARLPAAPTQVEKDGKFVIEGNIFERRTAARHQRLRHQASTSPTRIRGRHRRRPRRRRRPCTVNADGSYRHDLAQRPSTGERGQRVFYASSVPPRFTTENYQTVLFSEGIGRSFINSLTVTIPATIIPILIAAFAAYALAWMQLPGPRAAHRGHRRPARRAAADVADPAAQALQRRRRVLRRAGQDLSRHLAGAYRLRPALRHLSAAQLHGRPAASDLIEFARSRRRQRLRDLHQDRAAAVVPGARLVRHLPVPLGVERPAGRHGVPRQRTPTSSC